MVAWKELNQGEKDHVLALLAVWTTLRKALIHGSELDRKHALSIINTLLPREPKTWIYETGCSIYPHCRSTQQWRETGSGHRVTDPASNSAVTP